MKRFFSLCLVLVMMFSVTGCGSRQEEEKSTAENRDDQTVESMDETMVSTPDDNLEDMEATDSGTDAETQQTEQAEQSEMEQPEAAQAENDQIEDSQTENNQTESMVTTVTKEDNNMKMNIQIGDSVLTATLVQNSSTEALIEMLSEGPVTIEMNDYASMEKVGPFPHSLPRNDEQISTGAGDLILYQGNSFVIYYDTNSWNFTRLGKIDDMTQKELMDVLGDGSVTAVLSLPTE